MNTITILIVATGKYKKYLPELIKSIYHNFLDKNSCMEGKEFMIRYAIFTENADEAVKLLNSDADIDFEEFYLEFIPVEHKPWPHSTLKRFHFFKENYATISESDYYFYIDADTIITAPFDNILGERVAVQHCGFMQKRGTYEERELSCAFVGLDEGTHYFGGGFWGFDFVNFWHMVKTCSDMVDTDEKNGIIPIHNDESVLNRYLIDNPPTKVLSPSYHYPQSHIEKYKAQWPENYPCRILLLDKNHEEMRSL